MVYVGRPQLTAIAGLCVTSVHILTARGYRGAYSRMAEWLLPTWQLPCECDNLDPRCERCARRQIGGLDLCESTPRFGLCWYLGRAPADKGVSLPPLD